MYGIATQTCTYDINMYVMPYEYSCCTHSAKQVRMNIDN